MAECDSNDFMDDDDFVPGTNFDQMSSAVCNPSQQDKKKLHLPSILVVHGKLLQLYQDKLGYRHSILLLHTKS